MDRIKILSLEPGKTLDEAVVTEIMHHIWDGNTERPRCVECGVYMGWYKPAGCEAFKYSTEIQAAFYLVDRMLKELCLELIVGTDGYAMATFYPADAKPWQVQDNQVVCDTVQEALCKAALLAKHS